MTDIDKSAVLEALKRVKGPDLKDNIVSLGLVSDIVASGNRVIFSITVPADKAEELEPMRQAAETVVTQVPGVESALVALTAARSEGSKSAGAQARAPNGGSPLGSAGGGSAKGAAQAPAPAGAERPAVKAGVPGVKAIIAVASGKGGVGKSTTAVNLALGLLMTGQRVGILDADIYGPSLPRLLRISGRPEPVQGRILKPMEGYGLKAMSMGFLVDEDAPVIWRGPMVISAITQMLREVAWGDLDILVVDMPPGTGDAQLTMAQQVPLAGAVIVSTPQDLALIDARKGLNMFRKVDVPVLGIVENMSHFICPHCGERSDIFGHGGARAEAERIGVPFLGEVPLHPKIREFSDRGTPVVVADPDGEEAAAYLAVAGRVMERLDAERRMGTAAAPRIVVE